MAELLEEEGVRLVPEEERYKLTDLDSLTGAAEPPCARGLGAVGALPELF